MSLQEYLVDGRRVVIDLITLDLDKLNRGQYDLSSVQANHQAHTAAAIMGWHACVRGLALHTTADEAETRVIVTATQFGREIGRRTVIRGAVMPQKGGVRCSGC